MFRAGAESNRVNAKRSTGPKTADGKARASKNALRHGLNTAAPEDGSDSTEVTGLAARLCGHAEASFASRNAAEAEIYLLRIRNIKWKVLDAAIDRIMEKGEQNQSRDPAEVIACALAEAADELLVLDGYERKARSRRKKACRVLWE